MKRTPLFITLTSKLFKGIQKTIAVLCMFMSFLSFAQVINYNDVAVIVNDNSPESVSIANYFQNARSIPDQNMIHISAPTSETITNIEFNQIRTQIENYLISHSLADSINYLVTTKGVPLKRENANCTLEPGGDCGSFDSELTLILGTYSAGICNMGLSNNPFYLKNEHFSRATQGIYLVTRLDGYTKEDVFHLIDNSGPNTGLDQQNAQFIVDMNAATGADSSYFVSMHLQPSYDTLISNAWNVNADYNFSPLANQNNVFAYLTTGHGPLSSVNLNNTWVAGSFSSMATNSSASTFDLGTNSTNNFLIANLIAEGCTAAQGYINTIYFAQIFNSDIFMSRYLNPITNYNLAECYFMAEQFLSSQSVLIGDPKASVFNSNPASVLTNEQNSIGIYPNPAKEMITISIQNFTPDQNACEIIDASGREVKQINLSAKTTQIDISDLNSGIYFVKVGDRVEKLVVE